MLRPEFEIFLGGAKGGGKSQGIIGFMMKGNPEVPLVKCTPVDLTYLNCPTYRGLVIRKNLEDLNSWIAEAYLIYGKMGALYTQKPSEFTFPSGAKIVMGHLDDDRAVEKYFGNVVHRAAVDELTFISDRKNYMKLLSCVRSNVKGIKPQVLSTGNPGGPGQFWVMERFIKATDVHGQLIPPKTAISEMYWNPFTKKNEQKTRIFIPAGLKDNPKLLESDPGYYGTLAILPEAERRAYLDGDWDAMGGLFFTEFRPKHREGDPEEACHVIQPGSRRLEPWYPRIASMDWGYGHEGAFLSAVKTPQKQVIFDREIVAKEVGSIEWGFRIGRCLVDSLMALKQAGCPPLITLWVSPDAYGKRDEHKTQVEGLAEGIGRVLGPNAVHIPELFHRPATIGEEVFFDQAQFQASAGIIIRKAQNARVAGANHCREMLRWTQTSPIAREVFDPVKAAQLRMESDQKFEVYVEAFKRREPELLPKCLITSDCPILIQSIPSLVHDEDNREDVLKTDAISDQLYDAWRYLLHSENVAENREPRQAAVQRHIAQYSNGQPVSFDDKVWMARQASEKYDQDGEDFAPFNVRSEGRWVQ